VSLIIGSMHIRLGDLASWVEAIGTVGTLAGLTVGRLRDRRAQRARDERAQRARDERAQAEAISGWYGGTELRTSATPPTNAPPTKMFLLNRSDAPVYRVVATLAFLSGTPPKTGEEWVQHTKQMPFARAFGALPPGRWRVDVDSGWGASGARPGVEVAFTDKAGRHWIRRADGRLDSIRDDAMTHYGIPGAFSLEGLDTPVAD
jgi:hypothetical protein